MAVSCFCRLLISEPTTPVTHPRRLLAQIAKSKDHLVVVSLCRELCVRRIPFDVYMSNIFVNSYANLGCVSFALSMFGKMLKVGCSPCVAAGIVYEGCDS